MKLTYRDLDILLKSLRPEELDMVVTIGTKEGFVKAQMFKHIPPEECPDLGQNTLVIETEYSN